MLQQPMEHPTKMPLTKGEIIRLLHQHETEMGRLGVERCGLFGSFVRDQAGPDSDVDVLVEFEAGEKSFDRFMRLWDLLERVLGREVDLVTREALSPHIGPHILAEVEYVTRPT